MAESNQGANASTPVTESTVTESETSEAEESEATEGNEGEVESSQSDDKERLEQLQSKDNKDLSKKEKEEKAALKKKFKIKVDGQEFEEEIDWSDEESIKKHLQLSKVSQKRMQESATIKKAAEQLVEMLRTNPKKVLSDPSIGVDIKKFAADILNEIAEDEAKTPEQKEIEKLRRELEERMSKDKEEDEKRKQTEMERLQQETERQIESDITKALETSGLPKTPYTVKKMAEAMMVAIQNGMEELTAEQVVPLVRKQMQEEIRQMFSASSDDVLEELLGKDNVSRLHKKRLAKVKKPVETASAVKPTGEKPAEKTEPEKKQSIREFFGV